MARLTMDLERGTTAPRRARMALSRFDHGLDRCRSEDAELLLSELVSNAVKHGQGPVIGLTFERADDRFRAEVVDQGSGFAPLINSTAAARDRDDLETPGGWGLPLVQTLSDRWGAHEGSTHVWFELSLD